MNLQENISGYKYKYYILENRRFISLLLFLSFRLNSFSLSA